MKMSSIVLCLYISILIVFAKKNVFGIITFYSPKKNKTGTCIPSEIQYNQRRGGVA